MIIQLRSTITYDVVGDQVVFLNPDTRAVYSLPADFIAGISGTTLTLTSETPPSYLSELHAAGLTDMRPSTLSRRKLLAGTGAVAGAGLVAMSLPSLAAASSSPVPARAGFWNVRSTGSAGDGTLLSIDLRVFLAPASFPEVSDISQWVISVAGLTRNQDPELTSAPFLLWYKTVDLASALGEQIIPERSMTPPTVQFSGNLVGPGGTIPVLFSPTTQSPF